MILEVALEAHHAGICVLPPREDGSKGPLSIPIPRNCADPICKAALAAGKRMGWKHKMHSLSSVEEIERWYAEPACTGLGFVCGEISGGLECLEFEGAAVSDGLVEQFADACRDQGLGAVLDRLAEGYIESTPGGGIHMLYFCPEVAGNRKLARRLKRPEEMKEAKDKEDRVKVLIETRGEGGYIIVAPSNGRVHPTGGKWELMSGSPATIPALTVAERDALFWVAETFDKLPRPETQPIGERPGQVYCQRATWAEVLEPHGWKFLYEQGAEQYWQRPGKDPSEGPSATTNYKGSDLFYNFSTSVDGLETERGYNKFSVYAHLNHAGDFGVAARALAALGFGDSAPSRLIIGTGGGEEDLGDNEADDRPTEVPWPTPDLRMFRGLIGDAVGTLAPHTEADAVGLLGTLLTYLGCMVGRGPHFELSGGEHPARHFMVLAGDTSKARKGSAEAACKKLLRLVDPEFMAKNVGGGLSSGEGLIKMLADQVTDEKGKITLPGCADKRLYICEDEFARILTAAQRDQSTLSMVLRQAWDGTTLRRSTLEAFRATKPHVCVMAHCTFEELTDKMSSLEVANGFANRFIFLAVRRSQLLPLGSELRAEAMQPVALELRKVIEQARRHQRVSFSDEALEGWTEEYARMASREALGLLGAYTARGDTHVLRLALEYALLDGVSVIEWEHMEAAMAVWDYSHRTVELLLSKQRMTDSSAESYLGRMMDALGVNGQPMSVKELRASLGMSGTMFAAAVAAGERKRLLTKMVAKRGKVGRPRVMIGLAVWG